MIVFVLVVIEIVLILVIFVLVEILVVILILFFVIFFFFLVLIGLGLAFGLIRMLEIHFMPRFDLDLFISPSRYSISTSSESSSTDSTRNDLLLPGSRTTAPVLARNLCSPLASSIIKFSAAVSLGAVDRPGQRVRRFGGRRGSWSRLRFGF